MLDARCAGGKKRKNITFFGFLKLEYKMNSSSWKEKVVVDSFLNGKRGAIPFATEQLNIMLKLLSHLNNEVSSFIDIGAGDGILSHLLLERYNSANGVLVDFSLPMIEAAKNRLVKYKDRIQIINADISNKNWQEKIFTNISTTVDAIISGYCIHHLPHGRKYELYQEIYNHLSPNGIFINIEHVASKSTWGEKISDDMFIESLYSFETVNNSNKTIEAVGIEFQNRPDKKDNILLSPETQCEWLREIGFKNVDVYFKCCELAVFSGMK